MKKNIIYLFWALSLVSIQANAFFPIPEEPPSNEGNQKAVQVTIGSNGAGLDIAAIRTVKQVVGHAVATGVIDIYVVSGTMKGDSIPVDGGYSFCAEAGYNLAGFEFNNFINELKTIQVNPQGTFYNINVVDNCSVTLEEKVDDEVICTADVKSCPDGSWVERNPPSCEFDPCRLDYQPIPFCTEGNEFCGGEYPWLP